MAKLKTSALVSSIAGKVGGLVFQGSGSSQIVKSVSVRSVQKTVARINNGYLLALYSYVYNALPAETIAQWNSMAEQYNKMYKLYTDHAYTGRQLAYQYWARANQGLEGISFPNILPQLASTPVTGVKSMVLYSGGPWTFETYNDYLPLNQWLFTVVQRLKSEDSTKTIGRKYYVVPLPVLSDFLNAYTFLPPTPQSWPSGTPVKVSIYNIRLGYWYGLIQDTYTVLL